MKTIPNLKKFFVLFFGLVFLVQCNSSGVASVSGESSPSSNSGTSFPVSGGDVSELVISNNEIAVDLQGATDDVTILLVGLDESNNAQGFEINASESALSAARTTASRRISFKNQVKAALQESEDITEIAHDRLRYLEGQIEDLEPADSETAGFAARFATIGDEKSFKVISSFENTSLYSNVNAVLAVSAGQFNLYIDERDVGAFNSGDLENLAADFDAVIPAERDLFGEESDINGDGRFDVLLTREVNKLGQYYGGLVTGFFYATDLFDDATYAVSNEREVIFGLVPDPNRQFGSLVTYDLAMTNILPGVLVHEFQHMVNFNNHYFVKGQAAEASWLNEGLSHLAEDIYSLDESGYMTESGLENPARVARYLQSISQICFSCGSTLQQRGGSYLFLRYLYEQAEGGLIDGVSDGSALIADLSSGDYRDIRNVANAVAGAASDTAAFGEALARYGLAVYLSGTGATTDSRFEILGLDLRGAQDDNRGTLLAGPEITEVSSLPFVDTIGGYGLAYIRIPADQLATAAGRIRLNVANGDKFKAYLIQ